MSLLIENEVPCPHCKFPNHAEVWSIISVTEDPELKDLLLGGELNMIECGSCKKVFFAEKFLIYHDVAREVMAFVYPYESRHEKEKWENKTKADFESTRDASEAGSSITYEPVTFFGLDELVQYVEADEEAKIQSEIVSLISDQHGFSKKVLSPYIARKYGSPPLLPFKKNGHPSFADGLMEALATIEDVNDRLSIYLEFRAKLLSHPDYLNQVESL